MYLLLLVGYLSRLALAQAPVTDPAQWPGWSTVQNCVQNAVNTVAYDIGCGGWSCVCQHTDLAAPDVLARAITFCSSNEQDIAAATSIFDGFCSQLPNSTATLIPGDIVTNPSQWPAWSTVRYCVQNAINTVGYDIGCEDWTCICEQGSTAQDDVQSRAINFCSSDEQDIAAATSIFDGFCSQLPGVTGFQAVETTLTPGPGATGTVATATPTGGNGT